MNNPRAKAIAANTADKTLSVRGTVKEIVAAFDYCKWQKIQLKGKFRLIPSDKVCGLNLHKMLLTDGDAVFRMFSTFTNATKDFLSLPFYDAERNAVIATNGRTMLFCDIPQGLTKEKAQKAGFNMEWNRIPTWTSVLNNASRDTTPYALTEFTKIGEVAVGSDLHNIIKVASSCAKAYEHALVGEGRNIHLWIGKNKYNAVMVASIVDALFRLGNGTVGFYETRWDYPYNALHIVGLGSGLRARGLIMPFNYPTTVLGGIELFS